MYYDTFLQMKKMLGQLDRWLEIAATYAKERSFDPNLFLTARLAPDQFPLVRQIQSTCDSAKLGASRLTGKDAPVHPDTEQTVDEIRARIRAVMGYLDGFSAVDFANADSRVVSTPRWEGKVLSGHDYFLEHAMPNFFFHLTHAYALLRHNGVPLGKRDYLGTLSLRTPSA